MSSAGWSGRWSLSVWPVPVWPGPIGSGTGGTKLAGPAVLEGAGSPVFWAVAAGPVPVPVPVSWGAASPPVPVPPDGVPACWVGVGPAEPSRPVPVPGGAVCPGRVAGTGRLVPAVRQVLAVGLCATRSAEAGPGPVPVQGVPGPVPAAGQVPEPGPAVAVPAAPPVPVPVGRYGIRSAEAGTARPVPVPPQGQVPVPPPAPAAPAADGPSGTRSAGDVRPPHPGAAHRPVLAAAARPRPPRVPRPRGGGPRRGSRRPTAASEPAALPLDVAANRPTRRPRRLPDCCPRRPAGGTNVAPTGRPARLPRRPAPADPPTRRPRAPPPGSPQHLRPRAAQWPRLDPPPQSRRLSGTQTGRAHQRPALHEPNHQEVTQ